jgi:hypothetical protein
LINDFLVSFSENVASSIHYHQKNVNEYHQTFKKYNKTIKRLENIINISWENLSDEFKKYVLLRCSQTGEHTILFNISRTCTAGIKCYNRKSVLVKNTLNCIDNKKLKLKGVYL